MRDFFSMFRGEGSLVRRSIYLAIAVGAGALALAQGLTMLAKTFTPVDIQRFSANSVPATPRTYTVTRSVLDDAITTGSIAPQGFSPASVARVDPCRN
jgi:hypothetical protein